MKSVNGNFNFYGKEMLGRMFSNWCIILFQLHYFHLINRNSITENKFHFTPNCVKFFEELSILNGKTKIFFLRLLLADE